MTTTRASAILRTLAATCLLLGACCMASAQTVKVHAKNEPLSAVVKRLKAEVSFDEGLLQRYPVTLDKTFPSVEEAIRYLIKGKPLQLTTTAGVYIISQKRAAEPATRYVWVRAPGDTLPRNLTVSLNEIVITAGSRLPALRADDYNSSTNLNAATARAFAGHADNAVFNLLRLMPGVRASGEPSDELYVWGSSPGESRVVFDGIPLFAVQSFNSNVSYINPYMAGEVKYKRGELSPSDPSLVGAVVDVSSTSDSTDRATFKAMVGTLTGNVFVSLPLSTRCQLSAAYRHTLSGLLGNSVWSPYRHDADSMKMRQDTARTVLTYDYRFQDANLCLGGSWGAAGSYKVALYGAEDYLRYGKDQPGGSYGKRTSWQMGASGNCRRRWGGGSQTSLQTSYAQLYSTQDGNFVSDKASPHTFDLTERVSQYGLRCEQDGLGRWQGLLFGGELTCYRVGGGTGRQLLVGPSLFARQRGAVGPLGFEAGLRADLMTGGVRWQPRALLRYNFLRWFTLTGSWGICNQYLVKNPVAVEGQYYQFRWDINRHLRSRDATLSAFFNWRWLCLAVEAYSKHITHCLWIVDGRQAACSFNPRGLDVSAKAAGPLGMLFASWSLSRDPRQTGGTAGELKGGGMVRLGRWSLSASYVFGDGYSNMLLPAAMGGAAAGTGGTDGGGADTGWNGGGQGVANPAALPALRAAATADDGTRGGEVARLGGGDIYSRLDVSASYRRRFGSVWLTAGGSVVNVLNRRNTKYTTSWMPRSSSDNIFSQAAQFTPIVFVEVMF